MLEICTNPRQQSEEQPLIPARMLNEYVYCPRLAYLEWVQTEWAESKDTIEGSHVHRRVDRKSTKLPTSSETFDRFHARSVEISSQVLGMIAKLDLLEGKDNRVTPVEYKRGKRPHVAKGAYDPERVQLCAQAMLLEEQGYQVDAGVLYFAGSKERVKVEFDEALRTQTRKAISELRSLSQIGKIPAPLEDSPKCPRCSLVNICLPDEVNFLKQASNPPRPISVKREESLPLYVQAHKAKVSKKGETIVVTVDDKIATTARLIEVSQLVLMGNVYVTTPCMHELMRREIPIVWHSYGGWFIGQTQGLGHKNVELRSAQYEASFDPNQCLRIAKALVKNKILNSRTLIRRNWRSDEDNSVLLDALKTDAKRIARAENLQQLLGMEGAAAARYFSAFQQMIKQDKTDHKLNFEFNKRGRRPPPDPINALLSYAYAVLVKTWTTTLSSVGFDPYRGFYHQPRYGRPALALDMMEPFRSLIAESAVITAINNGEIQSHDFISIGEAVNLKPNARKRFIGIIERRMSQEITHPLFGYKISYRRVLEVQARLIGRYLQNELKQFPEFLTR